MTKVTNKAAKRANALRMTEARRTNLASVRNAAYDSGVSLATVARAVFLACGAKPVLSLYTAARDEFIVGRMAGSFASNGDNRTRDALSAHARDLITNYQGHGGKAKLRKGMKGRRTKEQELAYGAARVAWTGICKTAGVTVPASQGGGDTSATRRKPQPAKKATAKAANSNDKPTSPKLKDKAALLRYGLIQAKALQGTLNKNASIAPPAFSSAVQDFLSAMKALNA